MKIRLKEFKSVLWNKYHHTEWDFGGCSTCGPYSYEVMGEEEFGSLLEEIDSWIEENYGS